MCIHALLAIYTYTFLSFHPSFSLYLTSDKRFQRLFKAVDVKAKGTLGIADIGKRV